MFEATPLKDVLIYKPQVFKDSRGYFLEGYNEKRFRDNGINAHFCQDNRSLSYKGTLRGLHFQKDPFAQAKLVTASKGTVFDVCVDLRAESPTFGKWFGTYLSGENPTFLFIPRGFAHGFLTISESAEFSYKVDNDYNKESEGGLRFDDPTLSINWPKLDCDYILSDKDAILPSFKEVCAGMDRAI